MNWLLIILIVFTAFELISGYRRGFASMVLSLLSAVIAIVAVIVFAPLVKDLVLQHTQIEADLAQKIGQTIESKIASGEDVPAVLQGIRLPEGIKEALGLTAEQITGSVSEKVAEISLKLADTVVTVGVYAATFIAALIILWIVRRLFHLIGKIPVIGSIDSVLGLVFGLVECVIIVDTVCLIIMAISNTPFGETLTGMIRANKLLTFIYEHNVLSMIWSKMYSA